jgi:outer membrane protein assembly factor BamB
MGKTVSMKRSWFCGWTLTVLGLALVPRLAAAYDWLQFNGDSAHSGNNTAEAILGPGNVASLGVKYQIALPAIVDGAPAFLESVATAAGVKDLLFVTTTDGWIMALDAATGATVWSHQYGPNGCIATNGAPCFTTSSPAIDPNRQYVYSYGLDGYVHRYQVGDGTEVTSGGWPQLTTAKGFDEKASSALSIASSGGVTYLYVTHGGYPTDLGDYQGHVTAINLAAGTQNVFNAMCSDQTVHFTASSPNCGGRQSAIWSRPGVIYDAGSDRIFVGTGNSSNGGNDGTSFWSESVLAIQPDGTGASGKPIDAYTPAEHQDLDNVDADLGSTAPAILPAPMGSVVQHLAVQGGKDRMLRLINLANLSGQGGPGHTGGEVQAAFKVPQGGMVLAQPAVWLNPADHSTLVFVGTDRGMSALKLSVDASGNPSLSTAWGDLKGTVCPSSSPLVANNVVYSFGGGVICARNAATGAILWTSPDLGKTHWQSPVIANGVLYVTDQLGRLNAFSLSPAAGGPVAVVEFYYPALDHYFMTSLQTEIHALDTGMFPGWARTGQIFNAYPQPTTNANPVCRFYLPPGYGDSHFYSASPAECAAVLAKYPFFIYETPALFYIFLPDQVTGACPAGTQPVYRLWDDRADTNHRYTTSLAIRGQMIAAGWVPEGYGNDGVIMCSPQ